MANDHPIDIRLDRRNWLVSSASAVAATLLPASVLQAQAPQTSAETPEPAPKSASANGHFFTAAQHAFVDEFTETILPADSHSGGAKAAKVADYIDWVLRTATNDDQRALWREGIHLVDTMNQHYHSKSFVASSLEERVATVKILSDNDHMTDLPEVRFFVEAKHLTVQGYYTSSIGIHDELQYKGNRINQEFVGCDDPTPSS
jgi:hypothetical protein